MQIPKWLPFALLLGAAVFLLGPKVLDRARDIVPVPLPVVVDNTKELEGATLLLVHEKMNPPIDQVLDVRRAGEFAAKYKMAGFLDVDEEDEFVGNALAEIKEKANLTPPLLVAVKPEGSGFKVHRFRKWDKGLEDILK